MQDWPTIDRATTEEVEFFRSQGYVKLGRLFSREELDALRDHVDGMIAALPAGARPEAMDIPHQTDPWLFRYLAHPRVLDVMEGFIGPDIALWASHLITKPAGDGLAVPWHADGGYIGKTLDPMTMVTVWLAVDESRVSNGCMRVIPGSHRQQGAGDSYERVDARSNVFEWQIRPEMVPDDLAVDLELEVGEAHLHDAWTIHGSKPNRSGRRRCGFTMRYMPANVVYTPTQDRQIYLLRGRDRTGGRNVYTPLPSDARAT